MKLETWQQRDDYNRMADLTTRSIQVRSETIDDKSRSVEAVLSTENPVRVFDWETGEVIEEVLRVDGAELPQQMPLLNSHQRNGIENVIGSIRQIRKAAPEIIGRLFFAEDEQSEKAWQKVRGRHVTDVSIGYRVDEAAMIQPGMSGMVVGRSHTAGKLRLRVATKWKAREGSLVPIGADEAAKIRSAMQISAHPHAIAATLAAVVTPSGRAFTAYMEYLYSIGLRRNWDRLSEIVRFHDLLVGEHRGYAEALWQTTVNLSANERAAGVRWG